MRVPAALRPPRCQLRQVRREQERASTMARYSGDEQRPPLRRARPPCRGARRHVEDEQNVQRFFSRHARLVPWGTGAQLHARSLSRSAPQRRTLLPQTLPGGALLASREASFSQANLWQCFEAALQMGLLALSPTSHVILLSANQTVESPCGGDCPTFMCLCSRGESASSRRSDLACATTET